MRKLLLILALAINMPACGKDSPTVPAGPPPTTLPARSVITVISNPNPVLAEASGDARLPFRARFTIVITESAGLACNVNRVLVSFFPTDTSALEYNPDDIIRLAGTNFVGPRGSLSIPFGIIYRGSGGSRLVTFVTTVEVIDANNNRLTGSVNVQVNSRGGVVSIDLGG